MDNNQQFYTPDPQYQPKPDAPQHGSGMATAAMVLGIVSCVCGWCCCPYIAPILGIIGIVLAVVSRNGQKMSGKALAGLICAIVGIVGTVVSLVAANYLYPILLEYLEEAGYDVSEFTESVG